jgi:glycyl-tRNA synthetase beta chain
MPETRDLLIEIGTEELPPKALQQLVHAFAGHIRVGLDSAGLDHGALKLYATPRRLAAVIADLATAQPDRAVERRGPALQAAFDDDGKPTRAAEGFARSCGVAVEVLDTLDTDKGSWLVFTQQERGQPTAALIPAIIEEALRKLPIPKRMRWGSLEAEFVRPVHWVVLLFGNDIIDDEILGIRTGRETRGHRFHAPDAITFDTPADYARRLENEGHVIANFEVRKEKIRQQVEDEAEAVKGTAEIDEDLLNEVTAMVEWPVAVTGRFAERFLDMPEEVLISSMKTHQKYFHVRDAGDRLLPVFITVSNIDSIDIDKVREGNERVILPRLTDAEFFWQQDLKTSLSHHYKSLENVVYEKELGSMAMKTDRVAHLAKHIAEQIGGNADHAFRAGELCKCDLMTEMVYEFPELQGVMGMHYARRQGRPEEVAVAIEEHYHPRHAGDSVAQTPAGQAVAIADKLDTLLGIFHIGKAPTGDKDPYALRRAAMGVLLNAIENDLHLHLPQALEVSAQTFEKISAVSISVKTRDQVYDFILGRLHVHYFNKGFAHDEIDAVISLQPAHLDELDKRLNAVREFRKLEEADSLAAANKRCHNLIKKAAGEGIHIPRMFDEALLSEQSEKDLAAAIVSMQKDVAPLLEKFEFNSALKHMAGLRNQVDRFFDDVMVMTDDAAVRDNRLALLQVLRNMFLELAYISCLQG